MLLDARYAAIVKWVAPVIVAAMLLCGCAAKAGETNVTLHQRAILPDGTRYELGQFELSQVANPEPGGAPKIPGNEVAVSVVVHNAGPAIRVGDVTLSFAYRDDSGQEVTPAPVPAGRDVTTAGSEVTVTTTFQLSDNADVFRTRYLRVRVERPGYPAVTFSGSIP